jgi:biopolymer transport protein TolR
MKDRNSLIFTDENQETIVDLNLIPLIDVMLVLLVTFMVAAPLSLKLIKVNLPVSSVEKTLQNKPRVVLNIDKKGVIFLDKVKVSERKLTSNLRALYSSRKNKELFVYADKRVAYGKVVRVMNASKKAGVRKIAMLTKPLLSVK